MNRMGVILAVVLSTLPADATRAAVADYARVGVERGEKTPNVRYAWLPATDAQERDAFGVALRFAATSSSRAPNLDRHLPAEVAPGLWRIDLDELRWALGEWLAVVAEHPYTHAKNPLVVRGDWLVRQLADETVSDAYPRLLYGKGRPKTADEYLAFWKVDRAASAGLEWTTIIEGRSGVSVERVREAFGYRGVYPTWETKDYLAIDEQTDPLADPLNVKGDRKPDGQEWITLVPKYSARLGIDSAHAQVYLLSNQAGGVVGVAPVALVEDHSRILGVAEIRNPGSCHACHAGGLNEFSLNALRARVVEGVEVYDYDRERAERLEAYLREANATLRPFNDGFAAYLAGVVGVEVPPAGPGRQRLVARVSADYRALVAWYVGDVTLDKAAAELGSTDEELKLALAYAAERGEKLGQALSSLAHGFAMSREQWEDVAHRAHECLKAWRRK